MKTLKTILFTLTIAGLFFACEDESGTIRPIVTNPNVEEVQVAEGITLNARYKQLDPNSSELTTIYSGQGYTANLGDFSIRMQHVQEAYEDGKKFYISKGEFTLWNDDGDEIKGRYVGEGIYLNGDVSISQILTVDEGKASFQDAEGTLELNLQNALENSQKIFKGQVSGSVTFGGAHI